MVELSRGRMNGLQFGETLSCVGLSNALPLKCRNARRLRLRKPAIGWPHGDIC
jgi:hypothetical protein